MKPQGIALLIVFALLAALAGCNTVQGIGKDIEKAGQALERAGTK